MSRSRVVLVGPDQLDNLALGYLASSLERAGHEAHLVPFNSRADIAQTAARTVALAPDLVGLSIAFQYAVQDYFDLAQALRRAGFAGHITAGGHVPTFCYEELLRDCPALDSVVRHEGERTVVQLVNALGTGASPAGMTGVAVRADGRVVVGPVCPPVVDLDRLAAPKRRARPVSAGGFPTAFVIASRGCLQDCAYCCIRAFGRSALAPPLRLRHPTAVAEEVAHLARCQNVYAVLFEDDLFVLPQPERAIARMEELEQALKAARTPPLAFWIKGRPASMTEQVLSAARRLGVVHLFLGIENACTERLHYLGRGQTAQHNHDALARCRSFGLAVSFNLMLFDPDTTLEAVAENLDFAETHADCPWNLSRTEVYSGTPLLARLSEEGRLLGDYRNFGYVIRDTRAEIAFRLIRVALHDHAFSPGSLLNQLASLSFAAALHRRFVPGPATDDRVDLVRELQVAAHVSTLTTLREAVALGADLPARCAEQLRDHAVRLAFETNQRDLPLRARVTELSRRLGAVGREVVDRGWRPIGDLLPSAQDSPFTGDG